MTLSRFHHYAQVHGADIERWPAPVRAAARVLQADSDEARRILAEAAELDRWLDRAAHQATDAQVARLLAAIDEQIDSFTPADRPDTAPPPPVRSPWPAAAGFLVGMALLGFLAGDPALLYRNSEPSMQLADMVTPSTLIAWGR